MKTQISLSLYLLLNSPLTVVGVITLQYNSGQSLQGPVPDGRQCEEAPAHGAGQQPDPAAGAHDVTLVTLVHLPNHSVTTHRTLQHLLQQAPHLLAPLLFPLGDQAQLG